uniref:Uncharacterized protein n=1 Tax=Hydrogenovibrio crunogenus (strain DSM 25203 / XCL-2) TaxID=317025 RepID=Q31EU5_HYDCU
MFERIKHQLKADLNRFLASYWIDRKPFYTPEDKQWSQESIHLSFILFVIATLTLFFSFDPPDDLLRHIHAWQYQYDYRKMFDGYKYGFNSWYLFDVAAGFLYQQFGNFSIKLIQLMSVMLFSAAILLNLKDVHSDWKKIVLLIAIWLIAPRLLLARPTLFEMSLMFLAIGLTQYNFKPWVDKLIHVAIGLLIASFYHLFFIYLIPLILWKRIYLLPLIIGGVGWQVLTDGTYFYAISDILNFGALRIEGVEVSENLFALPFAILLLGTVMLFSVRSIRGEKNWLLTFAWFSLPMQLRYVIDNLMPVTLILLAKAWRIRPHPFWLLFALVMMKFSLGGAGFNFKLNGNTEAYFSHKDHVLTDGLGTNFWVIHHGADQQVKVAPAMEIGFAKPEIQQVSVDQKVTCELLWSNHFDKFVEKAAVSLPLPCLKLKAASPEGYKIWQVLPASTG